jgi:hypothetical protein
MGSTSAEPRVEGTAAPALPYDPPAAGTVSVRGFRLLVALTLVNTVLLASLVLGPQLFPFARQQVQSWKDARAQKQRLRAELADQQLCQTHTEPATKVVYEEDPQKAIELIKGSPRDYMGIMSSRSDAPPGWVPPVKAAPPAPYMRFLTAVYGTSVGSACDPLLFLHGRTTATGERFIVAVRIRSDFHFTQHMPDTYPKYDPPDQITFLQRKWRHLDADWWPLGSAGPSVDARGKGKNLRLALSVPDQRDDRPVADVKPDAPLDGPLPVDYGNRLRFYAGQPDADDASPFTIAYELDGRVGVIDGWLRDQGLQLRPREGALTYDARIGQVWKLPAVETATPPASH